MCDIVFGSAQCWSVLGEELPETMVWGRIPWRPLCCTIHRFRQWVFRDTQWMLRSSSVNCRDTAWFAQITAAPCSSRGGGEGGTLSRRPDQGEVQRGSEVWRRQVNQRRASALASKPWDRLSMHEEVDGRLWGLEGLPKVLFAELRCDRARLSRVSYSCLSHQSRNWDLCLALVSTTEVQTITGNKDGYYWKSKRPSAVDIYSFRLKLSQLLRGWGFVTCRVWLGVSAPWAKLGHLRWEETWTMMNLEF